MSREKNNRLRELASIFKAVPGLVPGLCARALRCGLP